MIVLDANVLIAYTAADDSHAHSATAFIARAVRGDLDLLINPVILAEFLVPPTREGRVDEALAALADIGVVEMPFPADAARALAQLRVTGLKMPDCCVLLTAMDNGAVLASFDDRLVRAATHFRIPVQDFN